MNSKIVIVGAGVAGIAAATKLFECGYKNIIVLEAENRIGGRVHTIPYASNVVDLGAQWCHGEKDNVVNQLAKNFNLFDSATTKYNQFLFVRSNGEMIDSHLGDKLMNLMMNFIEVCKDDIKIYPGSLGSFIIERYEKEIKKNPDLNDIDPLLAKQFLDFFHKYENSIEASDNWFDTSAMGYLDYWDCEGDRLLNWKDKGYKTILDILLKKYPDPAKTLAIEKQILLNKSVKHIDWSPSNTESNCMVECLDGTKYNCDHVIVTTSLGVLKEKYKTMFSPELPKLKINAINGLAIGTVDKIYVEFSKPFWNKDWLGFSLLWNDNDLNELRQTNNYWLEDIFGFYIVDYQPNILCGWISGVNARRMELVNENDVENGVMFLLRKFLNNITIPNPISVKRTTWYKNENFRGSYSYRSTASDVLQASASDLSAPLINSIGVPVLQFAGEATHEHYYSTVHGALESGWREAKRILDFYANLPTDNRKKSGNNQPLNNIENNQENIFDVIILGCGLAGLGAAQTLSKTNKNYLILEGDNTVGGRVKTANLIKLNKKTNTTDIDNSMAINVGAQWLHSKLNPLYDLSKKYNLLSNIISDEGIGLFLTNDNNVDTKSIDEFFLNKINFIFGEILEECEKFFYKNDFNYPKSMKNYLDKKFEKFLLTLNDCEEILLAKKIYDWNIRFQIIDNSCLTLNNLSAKYWGKYNNNNKTNDNNNDDDTTTTQLHFNYKNTFSDITTILSKYEINPNRILLDKHVININWSNPNNIIITCNNNNETYHTKHVIITFSIGFLKNNYNNLFSPLIPSDIIDNIEKIGFNTINKIFLQFNERWWNPDVEGFQFLWSDDDCYENKAWTRYLTGFDVLKPGPPNTLIGWIGGKGATDMEKLSDTQIIEDCINILKLFTKQNVPSPNYYYCTKWNSDKYAQGSYCFLSTNCDENLIGNKHLQRIITVKDLKNNINNAKNNETFNLHQSDDNYPLMLFAGEACHDKFYSTAHGAFLSGIEQTKKLLNFYDKSL